MSVVLVNEDSDDEGTVVDVEPENPFIDKTDRHLSSSSSSPTETIPVLQKITGWLWMTQEPQTNW